ncbi:MAG: methylated-DNA--[protein]-cysteine S-methyltransferase [Oleiphilaceae bacterium]|nr:methylated-DNA--[protein]-cysteine S-methyltransferase [Oleiphilaceae bacterium]
MKILALTQRKRMDRPVKTEILHFARGSCSIGKVLTAVSARGVVLVMMADDAESLTRDLPGFFPGAEMVQDSRRNSGYVLGLVIDLIEGQGEGAALDLPLDLRGTDFQKRVWRELQKVPAGETVSYADMAGRIGAPRAFRAVAGACGANRLAVIVPCHRVVASNGKLSGYRWGVERKQWLLSREARV